ARLGLIAIGALHLFVRHHGDLQHRVVGAIASRISIDEVAVFVLRFDEVHRAALLVVRVGNTQERAAPEWITRKRFVNVLIVLTRALIAFLREPVFAFGECLLFAEACKLRVDDRRRGAPRRVMTGDAENANDRQRRDLETNSVQTSSRNGMRHGAWGMSFLSCLMPQPYARFPLTPLRIDSIARVRSRCPNTAD